jgi:hypothetical protein
MRSWAPSTTAFRRMRSPYPGEAPGTGSIGYGDVSVGVVLRSFCSEVAVSSVVSSVASSSAVVVSSAGAGDGAEISRSPS